VIDVRDGLADTFTDPNSVDIPSAGVANDDHSDGGDMEKGQRQIAEVIIVIKVSRGWNNTAFERLQSPFRPPRRRVDASRSIAHQFLAIGQQPLERFRPRS
jgi:hypothetical protein